MKRNETLRINIEEERLPIITSTPATKTNSDLIKKAATERIFIRNKYFEDKEKQFKKEQPEIFDSIEQTNLIGTIERKLTKKPSTITRTTPTPTPTSKAAAKTTTTENNIHKERSPNELIKKTEKTTTATSKARPRKSKKSRKQRKLIHIYQKKVEFSSTPTTAIATTTAATRNTISVRTTATTAILPIKKKLFIGDKNLFASPSPPKTESKYRPKEKSFNTNINIGCSRKNKSAKKDHRRHHKKPIRNSPTNRKLEDQEQQRQQQLDLNYYTKYYETSESENEIVEVVVEDDCNIFINDNCSLYPEVIDKSLLDTTTADNASGANIDTSAAVCVNALGVCNRDFLNLVTPSKSLGNSGPTISCVQQLYKKLPEFIKRKRKSKSFNLNTAGRDLNRLASLRIRKPKLAEEEPVKKSPVKKGKQTKEAPKKAPVTKGVARKKETTPIKPEYPHLSAEIFNKIELLEEDIKPLGNNGSKRKRVYSATAALTFTTTRKRIAVQRKNSNVTDKKDTLINVDAKNKESTGNLSNSNNSKVCNSINDIKENNNCSTTNIDPLASVVAPIKSLSESQQQQLTPHKQNKAINTQNLLRGRAMSMYDRRYQIGLNAASSAEEGSGDVPNGGYLNAGRSSSASSAHTMHMINSDSSVGMSHSEPTAYYLPGGTANAVSVGLSSSTLSNGSGGTGNGSGQQQTVINHPPSMATLCNIGNSCYLNSVVYTLRFAPRFLHNLHHIVVDLSTIQQSIVRQRAKSSSLGRGISSAQLENSTRSWSNKDLVSLEQYNTSTNNTSNITTLNSSNNVGGGVIGSCGNSGDGGKSSHQLLTEKLHELYQSLHSNEIAESTEPHHAGTLLNAIQDVCSIFEGNQQQDAHEFLMCVLNSIRETCQALIKATLDYPDVILNGFSTNCNVELGPNEKDNLMMPSGNMLHSSVGSASTTTSLAPATTTTSSLSTKTSFFSRKSKRKDEAKNTKNSRLQSPLKDSSISTAASGPQTISNSLFYLNTVDLSGSGISSGNISNNNSSAINIKKAYNEEVSDGGCGRSIRTSSVTSGKYPSSLLKDKQRLAEKIRELGLDFFKEDFEGITVATTKCLSCETITEQKESMIDIAVPVPISGYDSSDYTEKPSAFIQNSCITREYFRGENKYRCEQCTGYTEAIRSISYEVLPRLLVIQLSRFSGGMEKINSYIPTSFTLQCFCAKCCQLSDANKLHVYKLYSVITHVGATMSVGHYIAYTCSLDFANEYVNCPKDRRNTPNTTTTSVTAGISHHLQQKQQQQHQSNGLPHNNRENTVVTATQTSAASAAASALASSGTSLMKKMKLVRSKASSSGDMSKNVKNLNGLTAAATAAFSATGNSTTSKTITNGINKLSMNTTCSSLNCCATRLSTVQQQQQLLNSSSEYSEDLLHNGVNHNNLGSVASGSGSYVSYPSGYGSTGRGGTKSTPYAAAANCTEPIWYMCDDDKIKAMTQREFEELLSPTRKITVTPYLLFYARFDTQASQTQSTQSTPQSQQPATSWSNESLQSGGGGVGSNNSHKM